MIYELVEYSYSLGKVMHFHQRFPYHHKNYLPWVINGCYLAEIVYCN